MKKLGTWWMAMLTICGAINVAMADETGQVVRLPQVKVTEQVLHEEQLMGPYQQPKWTSGGQIGGEAVYVLPAWNAELSQRWFPERDRDGEFDNQFNHEIEVGLPHRFQADFNENWGVDHLGHVEQRGVELEGRWAPADWDVIPLNPTVYLEWEFNNAFSEHGDGDAYEIKLLLAEQIHDRWHWALNGIYEQQVGGERATEFKVTQALTYSLIDDKLAIGIEMQFEDTTVAGERDNAEVEFSPGPSLSWRPTPHSHLDIVPLFGCTGAAPTVEATVVFGIEFGASSDHEASAPASARGR
jgi:hypothetical protein